MTTVLSIRYLPEPFLGRTDIFRSEKLQNESFLTFSNFRTEVRSNFPPNCLRVVSFFVPWEGRRPLKITKTFFQNATNP